MALILPYRERNTFVAQTFQRNWKNLTFKFSLREDLRPKNPEVTTSYYGQISSIKTVGRTL
uniref:Uncharacterized protein n=1 Tax=Glossina morsitans morsitans TaxID=37546 RepID=A0A1B0GDA6_GLOMM